MKHKSSFNNTYMGIYTPLNPYKWINTNKITYLSLWERRLFKFLDNHPNVLKIGSETIIVPYYDRVNDKIRRYHIDLEIHFKSGKKYLVEVKPKKQTIPPELRNKKGIRKNIQLSEQILYQKNIAKWESAQQFAQINGFVFEIWTEDKLQSLGLKV